MGLPPARARASLRFSLGRHSDERTIAAALEALSSCVRDRAQPTANHPTATSKGAAR